MEPTPNCVVRISYFKAPDAGFAYAPVCQSPPWLVDAGGLIIPPPRSRIIWLTAADPSNELFGGIRLAHDRATIVNSDKNFLNETSLRVTPDSASGFPVDRIVLEDRPEQQAAAEPHRRVYYAVGVEVDGSIQWDDPKIYNPGDD